MPGPIDFSQIMLMRAQQEELDKKTKVKSGGGTQAAAILRRMSKSAPQPSSSRGPTPSKSEPIFRTQPVGKPKVSVGGPYTRTFTKKTELLSKLPPDVAALVKQYGRA